MVRRIKLLLLIWILERVNERQYMFILDNTFELPPQKKKSKEIYLSSGCFDKNFDGTRTMFHLDKTSISGAGQTKCLI